jgi:5-(aminomethyl)-3-furanmethanol phosphate kinase
LPIDSVVKIGGALLADPARLDAVLAVVARAARAQRLVIVPGGGRFADAVRDVDRTFRLSDGAAHWMAVLAMDQFAHVITDRLENGIVVEDAPGIDAALDARAIPVLAPSRWLRAADPLPHSWEVTSDSIAAWFAGTLGAARLTLVKPATSAGDPVDPYFRRALPPGLRWVAIAADQLDEHPDLH